MNDMHSHRIKAMLIFTSTQMRFLRTYLVHAQNFKSFQTKNPIYMYFFHLFQCHCKSDEPVCHCKSARQDNRCLHCIEPAKDSQDQGITF
jgi:hypothetical protein